MYKLILQHRRPMTTGKYKINRRQTIRSGKLSRGLRPMRMMPSIQPNPALGAEKKRIRPRVKFPVCSPSLTAKNGRPQQPQQCVYFHQGGDSWIHFYVLNSLWIAVTVPAADCSAGRIAEYFSCWAQSTARERNPIYSGRPKKLDTPTDFKIASLPPSPFEPVRTPPIRQLRSSHRRIDSDFLSRVFFFPDKKKHSPVPSRNSTRWQSDGVPQVIIMNCAPRVKIRLGKQKKKCFIIFLF